MAYHILRKHPGDTSGSLSIQYERVPAESMIHYYRQDRAGQGRGGVAQTSLWMSVCLGTRGIDRASFSCVTSCCSTTQTLKAVSGPPRRMVPVEITARRDYDLLGEVSEGNDDESSMRQSHSLISSRLGTRTPNPRRSPFPQ